MNAQYIELIYALKKVAESQYSVSSIQGIMEVLDMLTNYMIRNRKEEIPTNISELFEFLYTRPVNTYIDGIKSLEAFILENEEINEEIQSYIIEENEQEEIQSRTMKRLLQICRRKQAEEDMSWDWEEVYKNARQFISDNYLIEKAILDIRLTLDFPEEIVSLIKNMYEPEHQIKGDYKACPICGHPVSNNGNNTNICQNDVCCYYIKKYNLKAINKKVSSKLYRLAQGPYRYILMPNVGEIKIYDKLCERFKTCKVSLYPNIDEYDIAVSNGIKTVWIDVKDTGNPKRLVKLLEENSNVDKLIKSEDEIIYLVVPDHRISLYKVKEDLRYVPELRERLKNAGLDIEVVAERNLISRIEEALNL